MGKLIVRLEELRPEPYEDFILYTIAMCHPKIFRRFKHGWSQTYYQSLQLVKGVTFAGVQTPDRASEVQYANDHDFMTALANMYTTHPDWMLPSLIPNLWLISQALPNRGKPLSLYSSDTCTEFHTFLCLLLELYKSLIEEIQTLLKSKSAPDIQPLVSRSFPIGYLLWKMASGYAFEKHLQNIQQLLLDPRNVPSNSSSNPATYSNPEENPEVSCNEEIEATLSFSNGPVALWKAYRDWVLLMVVHFEAVHTLRKFIRSASFDHKPINIQILLGTSVSREILPFDTYLRSSFFPGEPTENAALADFVAKSMSIKEQYIFATKALKYWENRSEVKVKYDTICSHISGMVKASRFEKTRHSEFETKTKKLLVEWDNSQKMKSSVYQELVANISKNFEEKVESLSEELALCGPVADLQTHFCGTLHCEASLASILDPRTRESLAGKTDFKDLLAKTAVGCPFDLFLLSDPHLL